MAKSNSIPGFKAQIFIRKEGETPFNQVAEIRNLNLFVEEELVDITTYNATYRNFGRGPKGWSGQADGLYIKDDAAQIDVYEAITNCTPVFIKITPDTTFDTTTTKREIFGGLCIIQKWTQTDPNSQAATVGFVFVGRGPLERRDETPSQAASGEICFCIEWMQLIYMTPPQTYQPPTAPQFSTGWLIDTSFYPNKTGTGNAPEISLTAGFLGEPLKQDTIDGCHVPVYIRYLCEGGPVSPSGAGTLRDDFIEVAPVTQDMGQLAIIEEMELQTGLTVGVGGTTYGSLYDEFNDTFLPANLAYEMDLSGLRIYNLELLNTLDNLLNVDLSNNLINGPSLDQITDLNLININLSTNLIATDHGVKLIGMIATLKRVDLSFNFMHECFLFGEATAGTPYTIDFYDVSNNFLASGSNELNEIKEFNCKNNTFPTDDGGFWDSNTFREINEIAQDGKNSVDQAETVFHDFSNTDLVSPHDTEISNLISAIATDQSITTAEATKKVKYDPDYDDLTHPVYSHGATYGDQSTSEKDGF